MALEAGSRVDRYVLISLLGEGAQGTVWKAEDPLAPGQPRALKLIELKYARGQEAERARREARTLAKLSHPSLCKCHGLFEDLQHEVLGCALDYVDGPSLADAVDDPRLTPELRQLVVLHVAHALAHAHENGAVHRDVKLENILLERAFWDRPQDPANVKLVDFGVAALAHATAKLTKVGHVVGTPAYMAPEQIEPTHWGAEGVTPASDLFAFGVVVWQLFVGGHPTGLPETATIGGYAVAYRRAAGRTDWPPSLPGGALARAVERCLQLYPADRYESAAALAAALEPAAGTLPSGVQTPGPTTPHGAPLGRPSQTEVAADPYEHDLTPMSPRVAPTVTEETPRPRIIGSGATEQTPMPQVVGPKAGEPTHKSPRLAPTVDEPPTFPRIEATAKKWSRPKSDLRLRVAAIVGAAVIAGLTAFLVVYLAQDSDEETEEDDIEEPILIASSSTMSDSPIELLRKEDTGVGAQPKPSATTQFVTVNDGTRPEGCAMMADLCTDGCCATNQDCRGQCNSVLGIDEKFALRLHAVRYRDKRGRRQDLENFRLCVRARSTGKCKHIADGRSAVVVDGGDLMKDGLTIGLYLGNKPYVHWEEAALVRWTILRSAICKGLDFYFEGKPPGYYRKTPSLLKPLPNGRLTHVTFFLDPVDSAPPPRCDTVRRYQ